MPGRQPIPVIERLMRRVVVSGECLLFTGATNGRGYGVIGGPGRRNVYVHRAVFEHAHGPIPEGFEVAHHCDVRNCVRLAHLFLATHAENVADQVAKGRNRRGAAMYWTVKLTEDDVRAIRRLHAEGRTASSLAREFGISSSNAENIVNRKRWKHVD